MDSGPTVIDIEKKLCAILGLTWPTGMSIASLVDTVAAYVEARQEFVDNLTQMRKTHGFESWAEALVEIDKLRAGGINSEDAKYLVDLIDNSRIVTDPDGDQFGRSIGKEAEQVYAKLKLIAKGPRLVCDKPPPGWACTRTRGHSGPCAAIQVIE